MKNCVMILCFLLPCLSFGQKSYTIRGTLVDSVHQAVSNSVIVLMTQADSMQLKLDYFSTNTFEVSWIDRENRDVMLYISAVGYNSRYVEIDRSRPDLGEIMMTPLSLYMEEVTVSAKTPIGHKFERGRDEYTIPEWLSERSYDLNSLLALIPGLVMANGKIEIAGIGKPVYLINGLPPRMGELENLTPKGIEKITIIRMPGAKYGKEIIGLICIETKKTWQDYLSMRVKNDFKYTNEVNNISSLSVNFKKDKLSHFLNYSYSYLPEKYESWDTYETKIVKENINYLMSADMVMYKMSKKHTILYSPQYQFNDHSFIDVQYLFSTSNSAEDNQTRSNFADGSKPNLLSQNLGDGDQKMHYATLRYDNTFGLNRKNRITYNTVYMRNTEEGKSILEEESILSGQLPDITLTPFRQTYCNEVLTLSLDGKLTLWNVLEAQTGASYGNLWTRSGIDYYTGDYSSQSYSRNQQVKFYLNIDHTIGEFNYQLGLRGEYEWRQGDNTGGDGKKAFYFLPTAGASYRVSDDLNFMLYYRRIVDYPTVSQLNTNILYFNKYMYNTGNPSLKPTISNSLMTRMVFPLNFALTCNYFYKKNDILTSITTDKNDPKVIAIVPDNLDKTHILNLTLSWNRTFGFYYLNLDAGYSQYFVRSGLIDSEARFRPTYSFNATHSFTINRDIQAVIYMHYQTASNYYHVYTGEFYVVSPQLHISLLGKRLNIKISGDNLLNSGNHYEREKYGHTLSISESDHHFRGISVGISYNFNNFMDLFRKNEAGDDLIKRAKTD